MKKASSEISSAAVRRGRRVALVAWVLALLPLAYLSGLSYRCYVDAPFSDEWELVRLVEKLDQSTLSVRDLWAQHNEHRPLFGLVILLALIRTTAWNVGAEVAANVVAGAGIFIALAWSLVAYWPREERVPFWLIPLLSVLVLSPSQYENWLWGWQVIILLTVLAAVAGLSLVAGGSSWPRVATALACGVVATYSFAVGLLYWVVGPIALWSAPPNQKRSRIAAWALAGTATIASYFYDYHSNPGHPSWLANFASFERFGVFLLFILKFLGTGLVSGHATAAAVAAAAGLGLFVWLAGRLTHRSPSSPAVVLAVSLGLFALLGAVMTGLGRAGFGSNQPTAPRYVTISVLFWAGIMILAALPGARTTSSGERARASSLGLWARRGVLTLVLISSVANARSGTKASLARYEHLRPARRALFTGRDNELLARLYPDPGAVRQRRLTLERLHLSVFRQE